LHGIRQSLISAPRESGSLISLPNVDCLASVCRNSAAQPAINASIKIKAVRQNFMVPSF